MKIVRKTADGTVEVYFDDMEKPVMTAKDKTFVWGRISVGTFDDLADFKPIWSYQSVKVEKPVEVKG